MPGSPSRGRPMWVPKRAVNSIRRPAGLPRGPWSTGAAAANEGAGRYFHGERPWPKRFSAETLGHTTMRTAGGR